MSLALKAPGAGHTPPKFFATMVSERWGEVAEVVGEVRVGTVEDRLVRVARVLAERHLAQQKEAQRVETVGSATRRGPTTLPTDFDIFSVPKQEAVGEDVAPDAAAPPTSGRPASRPHGNARCPCR